MRTATLVTLVALGAGPAWSQTPLTLNDAMSRARSAHPSARSAAAAEREAAERERQARAGYYPRVDVAETWQRGNQPVFVFSSLLGQRRFGVDDFAIDALNRPDALNNFRTSIGVEQPLYDAGQTRAGVRAAELRREAAGLDRERTGTDLALAAADAYVSLVRADADMRASRDAVAAAEEDRRRAHDRREVGLATDADVLALDVHLAEAKQGLETNNAERLVAQARLAELLGEPLDTTFELAPLPTWPAAGAVADLEQEALQKRPEARAIAVSTALAETTRRQVAASFLPRVDLLGGVELNGGTLTSQRSSWLIGTQVRLNLFRGFADRARLAEAREGETRARADGEQLARRIRLDVRSAAARLDAARTRVVTGQAAVTQAREAQRIVRDRYASGLASITDVLRAADALARAEALAIAATTDLLKHAIALDGAIGRL